MMHEALSARQGAGCSVRRAADPPATAAAAPFQLTPFQHPPVNPGKSKPGRAAGAALQQTPAQQLLFFMLGFYCWFVDQQFPPRPQAPAARSANSSSCASSKTAGKSHPALIAYKTHRINSAGQRKLSKALAQPQRRTFASGREGLKSLASLQPVLSLLQTFSALRAGTGVCPQGSRQHRHQQRHRSVLHPVLPVTTYARAEES